jgi:chromatin remodeling complex protein RSC6
MNAIPAAGGPGFLAALFPLTRFDDSLDVKITAADGKPRISVRALNYPPLEAVGTFAELERDLPAAVAKYAEWIESKEASRGGALRIKFPAGMEPSTPAAAPAEQRSVREKAAPKKRRAAKKIRPRPLLPRRLTFMQPMHPSAALAEIVGNVPLVRTEVTKRIWRYINRNSLQDKKNRRIILPDNKLKAVLGGKGRVSMFEMTKLVNDHLSTKPKKTADKASPRRAAATRKAPAAAKPQSGKPGKDECIADYKALKAKHDDKLTRRLFVDNAKTKRRYEKLWGNNWDAFVKEAEGGKVEKPAAKSPAAKKAAKGKPAALQSTLPAGATKKAENADNSAWAIKLGEKKIGATVLPKKPGDKALLGGETYIVQSVDEKKREIVVAKPGAAPAASQGEQQQPKTPVAAPPPKTQPRAPYAIKTEDGQTHGATTDEHKVGDLRGPKKDWEVIAVDDLKREYTVRQRTAAGESTPPTSETK